MAGRVRGQLRLPDPAANLAAGVEGQLDLEAGEGVVDRRRLVGVAGGELGQREALLVEDQCEGLGGRVGPHPDLQQPDRRDAVGARFT